MPSALNRWTPEEDAVLRRHAPNYARLVRELPHRTYPAITCRCRSLALPTRVKTWSGRECATLRRLWAARASNAELSAALPGRKWSNIAAQARFMGLGSRMVVHKGAHPLRAAISKRARERGISNRELDRLAGSGSYFYEGEKHLQLNHVAAAAEVLGLTISIRWIE